LLLLLQEEHPRTPTSSTYNHYGQNTLSIELVEHLTHEIQYTRTRTHTRTHTHTQQHPRIT